MNEVESILNDFRELRKRDEAWSRDVQAGKVPYDRAVVRGTHSIYKHLMKRCEDEIQRFTDRERLILEFAEAKRFLEMVLRVDAEDLIRSMEDVAAGRTVALDDVTKG